MWSTMRLIFLNVVIKNGVYKVIHVELKRNAIKDLCINVLFSTKSQGKTDLWRRKERQGVADSFLQRPLASSLKFILIMSYGKQNLKLQRPFCYQKR